MGFFNRVCIISVFEVVKIMMSWIKFCYIDFYGKIMDCFGFNNIVIYYIGKICIVCYFL